eukprot:3819488-Pleurochrysis_carterae.AAC.2
MCHVHPLSTTNPILRAPLRKARRSVTRRVPAWPRGNHDTCGCRDGSRQAIALDGSRRVSRKAARRRLNRLRCAHTTGSFAQKHGVVGGV